MSKEFDVLIFIGRFQPFHNGHKAVVDRALELADKVLIFCGSANLGRSVRNPFTFLERMHMIKSVYFHDLDRIQIEPLDDNPYNDVQWVHQVQNRINNAVLHTVSANSEHVTLVGTADLKVGLIGCQKDHTSYYLSLFPGFKSVNVDYKDNIDATNIRETLFSDNNSYVSDSLPVHPNTLAQLKIFRNAKIWQELADERQFLIDYRKSVAQYPRIEHTVDAVVVQSGNVLLIRRRALPGKGLWAIPGGFVNQTERLLDATIRELQEETGIKVPETVLRGSIAGKETYDHPNRSQRGRIITEARLFLLKNSTKLPKVKGSDDADKAKWVPLTEIKPADLFEDHAFIIQDLIAKYGGN